MRIAQQILAQLGHTDFTIFILVNVVEIDAGQHLFKRSEIICEGGRRIELVSRLCKSFRGCWGKELKGLFGTEQRYQRSRLPLLSVAVPWARVFKIKLT